LILIEITLTIIGRINKTYCEIQEQFGVAKKYWWGSQRRWT